MEKFFIKNENVQFSGGETRWNNGTLETYSASSGTWEKCVIETTQQKVLSWAKERNILAPENHKNQYIKLIEEIGELSNAILKDKKEEQKDALGDVMVVLTILADQLGFDLFECYDAAYEVIKNRTGKTVNGTFIKNE